MIISNVSLTLLMSDWIQNLWELEDIEKPRGTPKSQFRSNGGPTIQDINTLDIDQIQSQIP